MLYINVYLLLIYACYNILAIWKKMFLKGNTVSPLQILTINFWLLNAPQSYTKFRSRQPRVFFGKVALEVLADFLGNTCDRVFLKLQTLLKGKSTKVFSCEFF